MGAGDDAQNKGLDQTKGFTNFSHIATPADLASTFVRDRVTAMSQKGIKATIDLGLVLWCGAPTYRNLCPDWAARWETWKTNNASILTSDKVLAFAILDEPFNRKANMPQYEAAAAKVKTDFPWAKTWMVEAACVVYGDNCGYFPGGGAYAAYTGTLPNIDWIGIDSYGIHPNTNTTFLQALHPAQDQIPRPQVGLHLWTATGIRATARSPRTPAAWAASPASGTTPPATTSTPSPGRLHLGPV